MRIVVRDYREIGVILDFAHDCEFRTDDLRYNSETQCLELPFERENRDRKQKAQRLLLVTKWKFPIIESVLRLHHVSNYDVEDKAQIGLYSLDDIEYDERARTIRVSADPLLSITAVVSKLLVELEDTERVIRERNMFSLGGC
jgi:hypothetical protein